MKTTPFTIYWQFYQSRERTLDTLDYSKAEYVQYLSIYRPVHRPFFDRRKRRIKKNCDEAFFPSFFFSMFLNKKMRGKFDCGYVRMKIVHEPVSEILQYHVSFKLAKFHPTTRIKRVKNITAPRCDYSIINCKLSSKGLIATELNNL